MCTASVYKGSVAILVQALLTARENGVLDHVLDDLGELADGAGRSIARSATKSARYVGEMREIAATQAAAGLTPALFEAMAEVYSALSRRPLAQESPESIGADVELADVLRTPGAGRPVACGSCPSQRSGELPSRPRSATSVPTRRSAGTSGSSTWRRVVCPS